MSGTAAKEIHAPSIFLSDVPTAQWRVPALAGSTFYKTQLLCPLIQEVGYSTYVEQQRTRLQCKRVQMPSATAYEDFFRRYSKSSMDCVQTGSEVLLAHSARVCNQMRGMEQCWM